MRGKVTMLMLIVFTVVLFSYVLNCGDVKASKVSFALRPLGRNITEVSIPITSLLRASY